MALPTSCESIWNSCPCKTVSSRFRLKNHAGGDKWNNIYVILNANNQLRTVTLPQGKYTIVCTNGEINENGLGEMEGGEVMVDGQSALILHD